MSSDRSTFEALGLTPDAAIRVRDVSKRYVMFERPEDRFKQMVVPRLERLVGRPPRRYFRDFAALSGISFEIGRGETVGIIGRNGSGKSTLLQIICGTLQPTSGSVEVNGRIAALLELGAGFNPEFTGRENVFLNASILGVPRREMEWRFDDIARFADIGPFIDQPVKTYSSGMYVRLAFATAINVDPDILVVDEALSVGDEAFQRKCFARIEDIKDRGGTILFVSHGAQTIVQLCTRAILIDGGEKILEGKPKKVVGQYQRLIHAPAHRAGPIRSEILKTVEEASDGDSPESRVDFEAPPAEDFFDPNLSPQGTIAYEENGATIFELKITRTDGHPANVLVQGQTYQCRYSVKFSRSGKVGFAMLVKTVQGLELAGQTSHRPGEGHSANAGDVFDICFPFKAVFLPGTYFANAGVYISGGSEEFQQLHRLVDAIAFKIMPNLPTRARIGMIDIVPDEAENTVVTKK
ncbi:ABC transporter ATP-binding protein [Mesorhizobium sp. LjRoot246]|uniref:ABC transporter ATP-binding protein n=1 Tax=Mesorhizobium sp. LjRoot246 TaxID=3342294 RepID=UPI003ECED473